MTEYHKVTASDCLKVATEGERRRLDKVHDSGLMLRLADRWCVKNWYILGGYLGDDKWDATKGGGE